MKKISAVLLVLVLVGSVAFAGFTGSMTTGFGFNFDTQAYGFITRSNAVSVDVNLLELVSAKKGEGDIYADVKATLNFNFNNADESDLNSGAAVVPGAEGYSVTPLILQMSFTHAKVVAKDWYAGILAAVRAPNFATSAIDSKDFVEGTNDLDFAYDDATYYADIRSRDFFDRTTGVEFGYKGFVVGAGLTGDVDAGTYNVFGSVLAPAMEVADGLKLTVGAAGSFKNTGKGISGHVKGVYTSDELNATVGADLIYTGANGFKADAAAKIAVDPVAVDVYFATNETYGAAEGWNNARATNLLSAKVVTKLDPVTLTVTGKDLVNTQNLSASAKFQASEELAVTVTGGFKVSDSSWSGGGSLAYTAEKFTAAAGATYRSTGRISANASIESTKIVNGATLKLAYAGDDLTDADNNTASGYDNGEMGKVVASVKIAF